MHLQDALDLSVAKSGVRDCRMGVMCIIRVSYANLTRLCHITEQISIERLLADNSLIVLKSTSVTTSMVESDKVELTFVK